MKEQTIQLNGKEVTYKIIPKNNKNTYFKFRKDGTIEITKSRYQSKRDIIKYMKENAHIFLKKLEKVTITTPIKEGYYLLFGEELKIEYYDQKNVTITPEVIYIPNNEIDPEGKRLRKQERDWTHEILQGLHQKYLNNPYIDINDITIKVRHTKTRFGSCNAARKSINLNANLMHYNPKYLEYVFLHEIAHLVHQNHSKDYYLLLSKLCPNYKELRKELREIYR